MANSSVHFPREVVARLDKAAKRLRVSRNRLIVRACEQYLEQADAEGSWPPDFFEPLPEAERRELEAARNEMEEAINSSRKSRKGPPF